MNAIYKIKSPSGKCYIGQTTNLKRRMKEYKCRKTKNKTVILKTIEKYGFENMKISILWSSDLDINLTDTLNTLEKFYIEVYNCMVPNGYNLQTGGNYFLMSEETRKKMSESRMGEKNPMYGKVFSAEYRKKMSDAAKQHQHNFLGKHHSDESKQKIREAHIGLLVGEKNPMFGKHHSDAAKEKCRQASIRMHQKITTTKRSYNKGKQNSMFGKKHTDEIKEKCRQAAIKRWQKIKQLKQAS